MENQAVFINLDEPFMVQQAVRDILKLPSDEEPVPKVILEGLLEVAKLVVTDELKRVTSHKFLAGLLIGYQAPLIGSRDLGEVYSVEWGQLPKVKEVIEDDEEETDEDIPELGNSITSEFLDKLATRLEEAMIAKTPAMALERRTLLVRVRVYVRVNVRVNVESHMLESRTDFSIMECGCPDQLGQLYKKRLIFEDGEWRAKCTKRPC